MSVVLPVIFDICMWILLNEFTIYFMGYKVRLCGVEKICRQAKERGKVFTNTFTGIQTMKRKTQNSNKMIPMAWSEENYQSNFLLVKFACLK